MEIKHFKCVVDSAHGIYTPQIFAEQFPKWLDDAEEKSILLAGPEHEDYWDVWNDVIFYEREDQFIWLGESGDVFILSNSPMQALVTAWESMEELEDCPTELRSTVQKLAHDFLIECDEFISEEEALYYFKPSPYNDALVNKALEWMQKELEEAR